MTQRLSHELQPYLEEDGLSGIEAGLFLIPTRKNVFKAVAQKRLLKLMWYQRRRPLSRSPPIRELPLLAKPPILCRVRDLERVYDLVLIWFSSTASLITICILFYLNPRNPGRGLRDGN